MVDQAQDEIRAVLRLERRVPYRDPDNFSITTAEQMIEQFHSVTATVALVMVILSSIGLLVGGIGVMNIMLVSVTERTREIGIRKAIGARKSDIIVQFLTEAVVLTALGGILGLMIGWLISLIAGLVFPNLPTAVPLWAATLGRAGLGRGGPVLRNLARGPRGAAGPGGSAALRIAHGTPESLFYRAPPAGWRSGRRSPSCSPSLRPRFCWLSRWSRCCFPACRCACRASDCRSACSCWGL